jgi:CRISPR-associated protein Cas2
VVVSLLYVVIVYDVDVARVPKVCKFLRRYLHWVQNSVFEGSCESRSWRRYVRHYES